MCDILRGEGYYKAFKAAAENRGVVRTTSGDCYEKRSGTGFADCPMRDDGCEATVKVKLESAKRSARKFKKQTRKGVVDVYVYEFGDGSVITKYKNESKCPFKD